MNPAKNSEQPKAAPAYENHVTLTGYLGRDPEVLEGRAVLSLATKKSWKLQDSDQWQSRTDWHRIVAWGPLAEIARSLAKGDHVFGRHNFAASVTMPAYVSGIFRVKFPVFLLGAVTAGAVLIGLYVGLSYFLGAEIAERIGNTGAKAVLGVAVVVAAGLGIKAGLSRWRATRQSRESEMV